MGWLFSHYNNKKELAEHCVKDIKESSALYLGHSLVGNTLYIAIQYKSERLERQVRAILVYLLQNDRKNYCNWGYKDMDESSHPYYYTCPLNLLDITDCMKPEDENSIKWRAEVRKYHENKKKQNKIKDFQVGNMVRFNEDYAKIVKEELKTEIFEVHSIRAKSIIIEDTNGKYYRAKAKNIVKLPPAKIVKIIDNSDAS